MYDLIEKYAQKTGLKIEYFNNYFGQIADGKSYYEPEKYLIHIPKNEDQTEELYNLTTCFHELVHSTSKPLNRKLSFEMASPEYAQEELIAELGAILLYKKIQAKYTLKFGNEILDLKNLTYLSVYFNLIKKSAEPKFEEAMNEAQKAVDYILKNMEVK